MDFLIKELKTELDAFAIYSLFKEERTAAILDSGMGAEDLGRYSFIGLNPFLVFKYENNRCTINTFHAANLINTEEFAGEPFRELGKLLAGCKIENNTDLPYVGGAIGYFSYDLGRTLEKLPGKALEDVKIPDCYFYFYDNTIIVDNLKKRTYITSLGKLKLKKNSIDELEEKIKKYKVQDSEAIKSSAFKSYASKSDTSESNASESNASESNTFVCDTSLSDTVFGSNFSKDQYLRTIERVKQYIRTGDIYITNLTQRFSCQTHKAPYDVYKDLRRINPAPFAALMNVEDFSIVCSSPERFLEIRNKQVQTRPIKGTRPRGKTPEEDLRNKQELIDSEKDKSELLMIVDLERNDLSKVCKPHSVKVTELFKLEEYSTVFHLVSTVRGELKDEYTALDCLKACFPGGSISGAPKVRSMEIIEELEPTRRTIYTGCIGYLGFDGNADFNIVIRTILMKGGKAYLGVGGGITWESKQEEEYEETLDKARALMKVL